MTVSELKRILKKREGKEKKEKKVGAIALEVDKIQRNRGK